MSIYIFKKMIVAIILLSLSSSINAEKIVCLYLKTGDKVTFRLSERPKLNFLSTGVQVSTLSETILYYGDSFNKITYEEASSAAIKEAMIPQNTNVYKETIYTIDGKKIVDLSSAKAGVYIIKTPTSSLKLMKK